jgi:geranylgeranylglycerol-phosphate geranylgeranyltransferase
VAWLRLTRAGNAVISGIAGIAGLYLAGGDPLSTVAISAFMVPILIAAAGNLDNDICDLPIDRQWKPWRPLPSGVVSVASARWASLSCVVSGLVLAGTVSVAAFGIALGVALLLALYNRRLSSAPLTGNLAVAFVGGMPIVYGGVCAAGAEQYSLIIAGLGAAIAFWLHLAREILKDVLDAPGDKVAGRRTIATILPSRVAIRWAALPMIPAGALALWLGFGGWLSILYTFGVVLTVVPALFLGAAQCAFNPSDEVASRWTAGLKLIMVGGLIWMLLGKITL